MTLAAHVKKKFDPRALATATTCPLGQYASGDPRGIIADYAIPTR